MNKLIITGGTPLQGSVRLGGAKNASFKIMIASLLAEGESRILNFSDIADVKLTQQILEQLGCRIRHTGERNLFIDTKDLNQSEITSSMGEGSRASSMFLGPLLARLGQAQVPLPGGDKIGSRPLDRHLDGLASMGVSIKVKGNVLHATCHQLRATNYTFPKKTHTGTETLLMAAVLAQGKTLLRNAALEPEVDDLIKFLNRGGAHIVRKGEDIEIVGVKKLQPVIHQLMPDRNEAVTYAIAAIATQGDIIVENARPKDIEAFLVKLKEINAGYEIGKYGVRFFYKGPLSATNVVTAPHPGFMTDWQPLWTVLMTQAQGASIVHEAVFTSRFQYVPDLITMGAKIELFEPKVASPEKFYNFNLSDDSGNHLHAAKVTGPTKLKGGSFQITDIRAGATLTVAALIAQGKTTLTGTEHIARGYENLPGRLQELGAKIKEIA